MQKDKNAIKSDLFSFKTFRSPDRIDILEKNKFFIFHPNIKQSAVLGELTFMNIEKLAKENIGFSPSTSYKNLRSLNSEFHDFSSILIQQRRNDNSKNILEQKSTATLSDKHILQIWDDLFYQIINRTSDAIRHTCIQLIITHYYLKNIKRFKPDDIKKLTVIIPDELVSLIKRERYAKCGGVLWGVQNLGIADYRRVESELCCYVPSEVSHIENIMAKEYKEKSTENLLRTEYTTEFTTETEIENLNDTITSERNEINKEVAKQLDKDKSFNINGSVTVSKDSKIFGKINSNVSSGYSSNSASSNSNTEAQNYAKEVTVRALERVVQKTSEKRTYKIIKEFKENNKHGFDNRGGDNHVTGVYRFIDKIYNNRLINYGKKMTFEVMVPNPSLLYKKAMMYTKPKPSTGSTSTSTIQPPKKLSEFGIADMNSINVVNAQNAASYYGTAVDPFIEKVEYVSADFNVDTPYKTGTPTDPHPSITLPIGLVAKRVEGNIGFRYETTKNTTSHITLLINGAEPIKVDNLNSTKEKDDNLTIAKDFNPVISGSLIYAIAHRRMHSYAGTLKVKCVSPPEDYTKWQSEAYAELQAEYEKKLSQYNEEIKLQQANQQAEEAQSDSKEESTNPALNRLVEERELKRICIEMMSRPYCYEFGQNFYDINKTCKNGAEIPQVIQNQNLEKFANFVKFFETAFEWDIMTYVLFPYYYNDKCEWPELLQTKNSDPIFEAFLQSGMAKVLVPVRPQFEKAVMYFIETGEIWLDGDLICETEDDKYLSLVSELQNQTSVVEGEWETRVPTTLTIIQANTTYLEVAKGLPCCEDEEEIFKLDKERTLKFHSPT